MQTNQDPSAKPLDTLLTKNQNIKFSLEQARNYISIGFTVVLFIMCTYTKLKSLVSILTLQQIREVGAVTKQEHISTLHDIEFTAKSNDTLYEC